MVISNWRPKAEQSTLGRGQLLGDVEAVRDQAVAVLGANFLLDAGREQGVHAGGLGGSASSSMMTWVVLPRAH